MIRKLRNSGENWRKSCATGETLHYVKSTHPMPYDLFGQIPVTVTDCLAWIAALVPRYRDASPERLARYIRDYSIAEKVARAKAAGIFDTLTQSTQDEKD